MNKSVSAGGVVLNSDNKVLLVCQHGRVWSLPKGHVEKGEDMVATAQREIYEESGISGVQLIKKLGDYQRYRMDKDGGDDFTDLKEIHIYLFTTLESRFASDLHDDSVTEAKWVKPHEVPSMLIHSRDKQFFKSILPEVEDFIKGKKL